MARQLEAEKVEIAPVEPSNNTSPWVADAGLKLLAKGHHTVHYTWGQGFHTRGADGYFTVEDSQSGTAQRNGTSSERP